MSVVGRMLKVGPVGIVEEPYKLKGFSKGWNCVNQGDHERLFHEKDFHERQGLMRGSL